MFSNPFFICLYKCENNMANVNSYYLYQKYEKRGDQPWIQVFPSTYSVDGDGTMPLVVKQLNDPACNE